MRFIYVHRFFVIRYLVFSSFLPHALYLLRYPASSRHFAAEVRPVMSCCLVGSLEWRYGSVHARLWPDAGTTNICPWKAARKVAQLAMLMTYIRLVPCSNRGGDTGYHQWGFSLLSSVPTDKYRRSVLYLSRDRFLLHPIKITNIQAFNANSRSYW
jgi:hypothetical protein